MSKELAKRGRAQAITVQDARRNELAAAHEEVRLQEEISRLKYRDSLNRLSAINVDRAGGRPEDWYLNNTPEFAIGE